MTRLKPIAAAGILAAVLPIASAAQELTTINMINPLPRSTIFYPLIAGEALGYFEDEGIAVNLLPSETSIPYVAFLENGQADLAILDPTETLTAVAAGADIATIFEVNQSAPEGIAVSADSPYQSMEELAGTTVGLVSDRDRTFLSQALDEAGLSVDDVETVVVGDSGPTLALALRDQTVSAVSGASSDWLAIQANGIEIRMITPEALLSVPANSFAVAGDRVEEMREPFEGFLRAWAKGAYVAEVDPEILAEMTRQAVPEDWEDPVFGQQFLEVAIYITVPRTELQGDLQREAWEALMPRLMKAGELSEPIPTDAFLNDSFIAPANDWSRETVAEDVRAWGADNM